MIIEKNLIMSFISNSEKTITITMNAKKNPIQ